MVNEKVIISLSDQTELSAEIRENGSPIWLIATHGINEHLGRHPYLFELFGPHFNILSYDLRGHGKSSGKKGYIEHFETFIDDLDEVIHFLKDKYKAREYVLFGHSMGALITAGYMQNKADEEFYPKRVFLSAPPIGIAGPLGAVAKYAPDSLFSGILKLPSIKVGKVVNLNHLSHNPRVYHEFVNDELTLKTTHTRLLVEMARYARNVFSRPLRCKVPAFCVIGSEDKVVSVPQAKHYFNIIDKSIHLKVINGAYHEIHNEIERYKDEYFMFLKDSLQKALFKQEL